MLLSGAAVYFTFSVCIFLRALSLLMALPASKVSRGYGRALLDICGLSKPLEQHSESSVISKLFVSKIVEGSVSSRAQLGQALAELMEKSFKVLPISGLEISLYDKTTGFFYFSFEMGKVSAESRLDILELPLTFSGKVLGSVRFSPKDSKPLSHDACELAKLLTLQVGVLFINAQYSSELLRMQQSADETQKAKTGFLANLSHEVRAPLGVIVNATELVLDGLCGEVSEDQRHMLSLAKTGSEHLLELLNDVLDYAKIEAGKLAPQKKDISLQEILKDITTLVRFQAEQKQIQVDLRDSVEELAVLADRKHFRQILINLLTNAVKYTPNGGSIEVWAERAAGQMIRINVKDTGVGIDPTQRDKVFAPFERLNHSYSRQQAGVGLGLSLAKRLAEINGGSLDFESRLGEGSRFWFLLKSVEIDAVDKDTEDVSLCSMQGRGEELVIIDSDPNHLSILCRYLSDLGYNLKPYPNYAAAAGRLEQGETQLVIMDNCELDDPQSQAGTAISQLVEKKQLPVLLLSSRAFIFDLEKYLKLGVERCLPKPVPLKEIAGLCRQILDSRQSGSVLKQRDNGNKPKNKNGESSRNSTDSVVH